MTGVSYIQISLYISSCRFVNPWDILIQKAYIQLLLAFWIMFPILWLFFSLLYLIVNISIEVVNGCLSNVSSSAPTFCIPINTVHISLKIKLNGTIAIRRQYYLVLWNELWSSRNLILTQALSIGGLWLYLCIGFVFCKKVITILSHGEVVRIPWIFLGTFQTVLSQ